MNEKADEVADEMATVRSPRRVGVVVPPANPTVEPEVRGMLPAGYALHTARLPVLPGLDLAHRLARYRDELSGTLERLSGLGLGGVLFACTGSSYPVGHSGDTHLATAAGDRFGAPVLTAAGAIRVALDRLGTRRITVVSPYPDWLTEQCLGYWRGQGFEVAATVPVPGTGAIYDLAGTEVLAALDRALDGLTHPDPDRDAILVVGTGAPSLRALDERVASCPVPLLSSNLAGGWRLLSAAARDSPSAALRALHARTGG